MSMSRSTIAFVSGVVLYNVFVFFGGFLSAIAIPKAYFGFFGTEHKVLALFVLEAATFALPCFALSAIWSWATLRWLSPVRVAATWCLIGIVIGWVYWRLRYVALALEVPDHYSLPSLVAMSVIPPVWAVLNVLTVPLGLGLGFALWLTSRTGRAPRGPA